MVLLKNIKETKTKNIKKRDSKSKLLEIQCCSSDHGSVEIFVDDCSLHTFFFVSVKKKYIILYSKDFKFMF